MTAIEVRDCHIFSDVDGTLLAGWDVPQENIDAVARLKKAGGRFSIATGRSIALARNIASAVGTNAPSILLDGAIIYDYSREELIDYIALPTGMTDLVEAIITNFPEVAISVSTLYDAYEVGAVREYTPPHHHDYRGRVHEIPGEWLKLVLISRPEQFELFMEWLKAHDNRGLSITASGDIFVSVTAAGCSKGAAIKRLCKLGLTDPANTVAIGDYDNDIDMLEVAALAACPANAVDSVKARADRVLCRAEEGAVAQLIEEIMA